MITLIRRYSKQFNVRPRGLGRELILMLVGCVSCIFVATAQQSQFATITGTVVDDSTSIVLSNVNIYIANSTLGGNTDEHGRFEIQNVPLGAHDVVASRIGYAFYTLRVSFTEPRTRKFEIRLKPINVQMNEVVVSAPDPVEWRKQLEQFKGYFLGTSENAMECTILNPEVLDFRIDSEDAFEASARQPLQIDNQALGYHLEFLLKAFRVQSDVMAFQGLPKFTELKARDAATEQKWKENRMRAFRGSIRHFLICLFNKELQQNGYSINHLAFLPVNRPPSDRKLLIEDDILFDSPIPNQKTLRFSGFLEVEYYEDPEKGYNLLTKPGSIGQVSWLELNYYSIGITNLGSINEEYPTKVFGYWAWRRVGDMLPLDYEPQKK